MNLRSFGRASASVTTMLLAATIGACGGGNDDAPPPAVAPVPSVTAVVTPAAPPVTPYSQLGRNAFNRMALRRNLPLYWYADANGDGAVQPKEIRTLLFYPASANAKWVDGQAFTQAFKDAYAAMVAMNQPDPHATPSSGSATDDARRSLIGKELDDAQASLVLTDGTKFSAEEKQFVDRMLAVSAKIDDLYATAKGIAPLAAKIPADDLASQSAFRRNWGPKCVTPTLEKDPTCTAIAGAPKVVVDIYPAAIQTDDAFCKTLEARKDAKKLLGPFTVVRASDDGKTMTAVNFAVAYKDKMSAIAADLSAAADGIKDPAEAPLKAYLQAASKSFTTGDWNGADAAWAKMGATNSKWYLRIGPDETYWEPCNQKAGFHMTFARINQGSLAWQAKLKPVQQDMENALAKSIGEPYKARNVTFHLPDFIDIVFNAGDDRNPIGATIGESLPNWGPLVAAGKGRTVAMSNLYTDPDSLKIRRAKAESLFTKDSMALYVDDPQPGLLSTILHEATHNLGPSHEYAVGGKKDSDAFGGELSTMMEELKAQSGALYYIEFLRAKGILTDDEAKKGYLDSMVWALNHISRGMYTGSGKRKPYSQLAAIQVGFLMDQGALTWDPNAQAANGKDSGAYVIDFTKFPAAVDKLMVTVGGLKAKADRSGAEQLSKKYVDGTVVPHKAIAERSLKFPQPNFVYAIDR